MRTVEKQVPELCRDVSSARVDPGSHEHAQLRSPAAGCAMGQQSPPVIEHSGEMKLRCF